jgi:hypothetical protein
MLGFALTEAVGLLALMDGLLDPFFVKGRRKGVMLSLEPCQLPKSILTNNIHRTKMRQTERLKNKNQENIREKTQPWTGK